MKSAQNSNTQLINIYYIYSSATVSSAASLTSSASGTLGWFCSSSLLGTIFVGQSSFLTQTFSSALFWTNPSAHLQPAIKYYYNYIYFLLICTKRV